jgi:hypothetical protein
VTTTILVAVAGVLTIINVRRLIDGVVRIVRHRRGRSSGESLPGSSIEVDCRACGQFNRVPHARLRDRPKCGRCKARLMPGRRIVVCHTSSIEGPLRAELDAHWDDEDRLWQSLFDHVALQQKARRESKDTEARVVN